MTTGLGTTVGSVHAVAVTTGAGADESLVVPTVLALGGPDVTLAPAEPTGVVVSGFAGRVGDPVGLITDDGSTHAGEDLVAATVRCLAERLPVSDAVVAAHPAAWSRYQCEALADALSRAGLPDVTLVTESQAAVAWWQRTHPGADAAPVVVYDLGAGSLDVTVVRPAPAPDLPEILGGPIRSEELSGSGFDHATTGYVLDQLSGSVEEIDPFEPSTVAALAELRSRCRAAKEALSADTATVVAVDLPGVRCDVRLVREELEGLLREPLTESVVLVQEAIRGAGLDVGDVGAILLVGGSSAVPLVTELLSATLRLPVVSGPDPVTTAAAGAALLAVETADAATAPTVADTDTAAMTVVGSALAAPAPAPLPLSAAAEGSRGARTAAMSTPRRAALIAAAAAAVALLTAGGLSVGTGAFSPTESRSGAATTTPAPTTTAAGEAGSAPTEAGATVPVAATTPGSAESASGATGTGTETASNGVAVQSVPTSGRATAPAAGATRQDAPAAGADAAAPGQPAGTAGTDTAGGGTTSGTGTGDTGGGGTSGGTSGGTGNVGTQVGNAATGVGQGLGQVVGGVGQGVGGVLSGTGDLVGGVVGGTTGLVGGLLGQ